MAWWSTKQWGETPAPWVQASVCGALLLGPVGTAWHAAAVVAGLGAGLAWQRRLARHAERAEQSALSDRKAANPRPAVAVVPPAPDSAAVERDRRQAEHLAELDAPFERMQELLYESSQHSYAWMSHAFELQEAGEALAGEAGDTSAALGRLASGVDRVAAAAQTASEVAMGAQGEAREGASTVVRALQAMQAAQATVGGLSEVISRLVERSGAIGEIAGAIDDIAEQTNLVALNAAIEAAHAGEHGRGFAVVANEVRNLSTRCREATREIEGLLRSVREEAALAAKASASGGLTIASGVATIAEARASLDRLEAESARSAGLVESIAGSAGEQSEQVALIVRAMRRTEDVLAGLRDGITRINANNEASVLTIGNQQEAFDRAFGARDGLLDLARDVDASPGIRAAAPSIEAEEDGTDPAPKSPVVPTIQGMVWVSQNRVVPRSEDDPAGRPD